MDVKLNNLKKVIQNLFLIILLNLIVLITCLMSKVNKILRVDCLSEYSDYYFSISFQADPTLLSGLDFIYLLFFFLTGTTH